MPKKRNQPAAVVPDQLTINAIRRIDEKLGTLERIHFATTLGHTRTRALECAIDFQVRRLAHASSGATEFTASDIVTTAEVFKKFLSGEPAQSLGGR